MQSKLLAVPQLNCSAVCRSCRHRGFSTQEINANLFPTIFLSAAGSVPSETAQTVITSNRAIRRRRRSCYWRKRELVFGRVPMQICSFLLFIVGLATKSGTFWDKIRHFCSSNTQDTILRWLQPRHEAPVEPKPLSTHLQLINSSIFASWA